MEKTAIVLSGGGSCGAYEIGVWKALRKLKLKYDIITGTSIGALNGLMMIQNDYDKAYETWSNIDYNILFEEQIDKVKSNKEVYLIYLNNLLKHGGMNPKNLELLIEKLYDEKKFRNSSLEYGIVTYNFSKLKTEVFTKEELNGSNIKDYLMASATCFPAFKMKKINDQNYIDGGFSDNLPINLAVDLGADRIIAVDLEQFGLKKKPKISDSKITYIRPKNDLGSFLIFDKLQAKKNISYGYNDTLKKFGKLSGNKYTFYNFGYNHVVNKSNIIINKYLKVILNNKNKDFNETKNKIVSDVLKLDKVEKLGMCLDLLGKAFKLDDEKIYFIYDFNKRLKNSFKIIPSYDINLIKQKIKNNDINDLLGGKYIVKYIYDNLDFNDDSNMYLLMTIFEDEFLSALYLKSIL